MGINDAVIGFYVTFFLLGVITVILGVTPYITRRTEAFGVSVPENMWQHQVLVSYKKQYSRGVFSFGAGLMLLSLVIRGIFNDYIIVPFISFLAILLLSFILYYVFHKKTLVLKRQEGWDNQVSSMVYVALSDKEAALPSGWWSIFMFIITAATIFITILHYPNIPDKMPSNYGFDGQVTRYVDKSFMMAMLLPFTQIFMSVLFFFVSYIIKRSRVTVNQDNEELSLKQSMIFKRSWSLFTLICGTVLVLMLAMLQLTIIGMIEHNLISYIILPIPFIIVIASIVLSVKLGQGGSRIGKGKGKAGDKISMRDDDKYWKLGVFYYNPDDPALFVEKRFGIGWTSNFARPLTYVYLGILLLFVVFMLIFSFNAA